MKTVAERSIHPRQGSTTANNALPQKRLGKDTTVLPDQHDNIDSGPTVAAQQVQIESAFGEAIQRQPPEEEEELLQGKFISGAKASLQKRAAPPPNRTGLPDGLKSGVEGLSGLSLDDVRVHYNSPKPAGLQALAYTQGADIHVAPGQERHLPHEAWHVVQQKQGRVRPTFQMKGAQINDDSILEKEADRMGRKAFAVKSKKKSSHRGVEARDLSLLTPFTSGTQQSIQRKVGFELEMAVLTDVNGSDPGYNTVLSTGPYFDLKVDHNNNLKEMTRPISLIPDSSVEEPYSSIIEIVTKPIDETAQNARQEFNKTMAGTTLLARNIKTKTENFANRIPLSEVAPNALENSYVGADSNLYRVPNKQALDANIQATIGVDLAQMSSFVEAFGKAKEAQTGLSEPILADSQEFITQQQAAVPKLSSAIIKTFVKSFGTTIIENSSDPNGTLEDALEEAQQFKNLEGLVSLMLLYLRSAAKWSYLSLTLSDLSPINAMTKKNFTPFLSHTDLSIVRLNSLTDVENFTISDPGALKWLKIAILKFAKKGLEKEFNLKAPMLKWGSKPAFGPTPVKFVTNVLEEPSDGITDAILPAPKQMNPESVGPVRTDDPVAANSLTGDYRRQAPVIEIRSLANRISQMKSSLGSSKFPVNAWELLCSEIFYMVREMSMAGPKQR